MGVFGVLGAVVGRLVGVLPQRGVLLLLLRRAATALAAARAPDGAPAALPKLAQGRGRAAACGVLGDRCCFGVTHPAFSA